MGTKKKGCKKMENRKKLMFASVITCLMVVSLFGASYIYNLGYTLGNKTGYVGALKS